MPTCIVHESGPSTLQSEIHGHSSGRQQVRPLSSLPSPRSRRHRPALRQKLRITYASHHDDCAHVFGEKGHIAGIPTCSKCTAVGARLRYTLRNRPHDFVAVAQQEVQEIVARPDSQSVACFLTAQEVRRQQEATQPQNSHYASVRARLEATLERSSLHADAAEEDAVPGILPGKTKFMELADVMYYWALGEAYLQHPQLQADMRRSLRRPGEGALAAGEDSLEMRSRVQLLDGPFYEGSYLIGSVNFVRAAADADAGEAGSSGVFWGGGSGEPEGVPASAPILDKLFNSNPGRMLIALEGDNPARMMRQGAARTYHMYQLWGYFQRRMVARRSSEARQSNDSEAAETSSSKPPTTVDPPSQTTAAPWRFFENVPGHLSKMRTNEAASIADRHRIALFGDATECITTLQAWQQMTHEAKWFGRALYDAEEFILQSCAPATAL